jgi:hypothetical protein
MSGRHGAISVGGAVASTIKNWHVTVLNELKTYVASNTKAGTGRRPGLWDWNGSFEQYGANPCCLPGDTVNFIGYAGPSSGVPGSAGPCATGPAFIESLSTVWNWVNNELVQTTYNMVGAVTGTGAGQFGLAFASNTIIDSSSPNVLASGLCLPPTVTKVGGSAGALCFEQATFTLTVPRQQFASSCTGSWRGSKPGIWDWTLALVMDEADVSLVSFKPGDFVSVSLPIGSSSGAGAWGLQYGIVQDFSDYVVDIETGAIITYTVNIAMSEDDGTGTIGSITAPSGTVIWPSTTSLLDAQGRPIMKEQEAEPAA